MESKYLWFNKQPKKPERKTDLFEVRSKLSGSILGYVHWYSQWRRYVFSPSSATIFDANCLADIQDFIKKLMQERRKNVA